MKLKKSKIYKTLDGLHLHYFGKTDNGEYQYQKYDKRKYNWRYNRHNYRTHFKNDEEFVRVAKIVIK